LPRNSSLPRKDGIMVCESSRAGARSRQPAAACDPILLCVIDREHTASTTPVPRRRDALQDGVI